MIIVRCEKEKKENDILLFFDTEKGTLHIMFSLVIMMLIYIAVAKFVERHC